MSTWKYVTDEPPTPLNTYLCRWKWTESGRDFHAFYDGSRWYRKDHKDKFSIVCYPYKWMPIIQDERKVKDVYQMFER